MEICQVSLTKISNACISNASSFRVAHLLATLKKEWAIWYKVIYERMVELWRSNHLVIEGLKKKRCCPRIMTQTQKKPKLRDKDTTVIAKTKTDGSNWGSTARHGNWGFDCDHNVFQVEIKFLVTNATDCGIQDNVGGLECVCLLLFLVLHLWPAGKGRNQRR